jgi:hypothetical protein
MSNHLAVATVTATLRALLGTVANQAVGGAVATVERPDAPQAAGNPPRVNLFLYQVSPNSDWRNADLPTRSGAGDLRRRPQAALNLHYLFSFYGNEDAYEPQRILGRVATFLHAEPILSRRRVADASTGVLADSDLKDQPELVRLVPTALSTEELSKLWSIFFQVPYRLSAAYQASVVLLEPEVQVPELATVGEEGNVITVVPDVPRLVKRPA